MLRRQDGKSDREVVVVGAGMVGVCCAWHLQRRGFRVTMVDRKAPGSETSWGNAGLIQRECVLPYPFPKTFRERLRIVLNASESMRYNPAALAKYWYAIYDYWRCSLPRNYDTIARQFATLIEHCVEEHEVLLKASKAGAYVRKGGFLELFRTKLIPEIEAEAAHMRSLGVGVDVLTLPDIAKAEPCVDPSVFTGGVRFVDAWRVTNPGAVVKAYAASFTAAGGQVVQASVQSIMPPEKEGAGNWVVKTDKGDFAAPNIVVAAGPWSDELTQSLGYSASWYPLRGYSAFFNTNNGAQLSTAVVDVENGFVLTPMQQGVRMTSGGELNLLSNPCHDGIIKACTPLARQFFPLGNQTSETWFGSRPCISDMRPVIGQLTKQPGLWMCFGHGHSGFTLGPVSGRLLAELMNGETPLVDPTPFDPNRF